MNANLTPFDPDRASEAGRRSGEARRPAELMSQHRVTIPARLEREIQRRGLNRSELITRLLEAELG